VLLADHGLYYRGEQPFDPARRTGPGQRQPMDPLFQPKHGRQMGVDSGDQRNGPPKPIRVAGQFLPERLGDGRLEHEADRTPRLHQGAKPQIRLAPGVNAWLQLESGQTEELRFDTEGGSNQPCQP
jgi:hypothetical protein